MSIFRSFSVFLASFCAFVLSAKAAVDLPPPIAGKYVFKISCEPSHLGKGYFSGRELANRPVPASVVVDFKSLNEAFYTGIDLDGAQLFKQVASAKAVPVRFHFTRQTQYKGLLKWSVPAKERSTWYFCVPAKTGKQTSQPNLSMPLFMDGGLLRRPGSHRLGDLFYFDSFDINGDGKRDIISGGFHDFIRVHENIATTPDVPPLFSENHTYNLADTDGLTLSHDYFSHCWHVSAPVFYDFNNDGKKDILLGGTHGAALVKYWDNIGTPSKPAYGNRQNLALTCRDGYKRGLYPVPCDLNGDGKLDLVAGSMFPGGSDKRYVYYFEGLSEQATDFRFKPGVRLRDQNGVIQVPGYSNCAVEVADWNHDGLYDLFASSTDNLLYWENQGSRTQPLLVPKPFPKTALNGRGSLKVIPGQKGYDLITGSTLALNQNNGRGEFRSRFLNSVTPVPIRFSGHGTFRVVDWNQDGKNDLVYANDWGKITCAVNDGGNWQTRLSLQADGKPIDSYGCVDPGENQKGYARMCLADLDGDGHKDLLINHELAWRFGYLPFYKNLGDGTFAKERRLDLPRTHSMTYGNGVKGQAAVFDNKTTLDYYSYPATGQFDASGGEITLHFAPQTGIPGTKPMVLLHNQAFAFQNNKISYGDEFRVAIDKQGAIIWHAGKSVLRSEPLPWRKNTWYKLEFKWNGQGMTARRDGAVLARNEATTFQQNIGPRLYIGSPQAISFVQAEREYKSRLQYHKQEYATYYPALGKIDEVTISDRSGAPIFYASFDGGNDGVNPTARKPVPGGGVNMAYRAAPAVADLNADGLPDLIMPISPQPNKRDGAPAILHWFINNGTKTQPHFLPGIPLNRQIEAGVRSASRFHDYDDDGDLDLLIVHVGAKVHYFRNDGTPSQPYFTPQGIIVNQSWGHESGLDVVDWNQDGHDEVILSNGDDGTMVFYDKQVLDKLVPRCRIEEIRTPTEIIAVTPASEGTPITIKSVRSDRANDRKAGNVNNGIREGGSKIGWWGKDLPIQLEFELAKRETVSQVDCYWGHPTHALNNPGGSRDPKSFLFEYWTGSDWQPLFPKVENSPRANTAGLGKTVAYQFPAKTTDKIRLTIYSTYDSGRRMHSDKLVPENRRNVFIREIIFRN
jgi:hypothetical protein